MGRRYLFLLAAVVLVAASANGDLEDRISFIQLNSLSKVLRSESAGEPVKAGAMPTGPTKTDAGAHSGVNQMEAPKGAVEPGQEQEQDLMIRQIFFMCVTMYGLIGLLWLGYWSHTKGAAAAAVSNGPETTAQEGEQASPFYVGLVCLSWASMSVGMNIMNKSLVSCLQAPALITAVQMLIAVVVVGASAGSKFKDLPRSQLLTWMIVPLLFSAMLCSSFYAYAYISLSLLTVVRNLTPLAALPIERLVMPPERQPVLNFFVVCSIIIMLAGALIYGDGILPTLSLVGLACAFLNMSFAVTDRVIQRRLLTTECKDLPSEVCTVITNVFGLIPTLLLAWGTHQLQDLSIPARKANWQDPQILTLLALSGFIGIGICWLGFVCQRAISATSFFVLQNVSKVAVVSTGVVVFGDPIRSPAAAGGLFLSLSGSFLYGVLQMNAGGTKQAEAEKKQ